MYIPYNYTRSIRRRAVVVLCAFIAVFLPARLLGQGSPVNIQLAVLPPYTSAVYEYIDNPDKIIVNITHTGFGMGPLEIYLRGSIISDGGISAVTEPGFKPPSPITLQEGAVFSLTPNNISEVFDLEHVIIEGIEIDQLLNVGLPEDNYQICLQAYDYYTDAPLSGEAPLGCSNIFYIRNPEPPQIIMPFCGDTIKNGQQSNLIISWTRPPGAPMNTVFTLYMTELPGQMPMNPNEIIETQLFPPFYEEQTLSTMLFLSFHQIQFQPDHIYAFVIQASDPTGEILFNNNGMSEVCWFIYEEPWQHPWINGGLQQIDPDTVILPFVLNPKVIAGNLTYHYEPDESGENASYPLKSTHISIKPVYVLKNAEIWATDKPGATYYDEYLMRVDGTFLDGGGAMNVSDYYYGDNFQTLTSGMTTPEGFFTLMFNDARPTGLVKEDFTATYTLQSGTIVNTPIWEDPLGMLLNPMFNMGLEWVTNQSGIGFNNTLLNGNLPGGSSGGTHVMSGKMHTYSVTYKGDLYRYYRVFVENEYYCSPEINISAAPGVTVNIGDQECRVQSYKLNFQVRADSTILEQSGMPGGPLDGVKCYVLRKQNRTALLPEYESMHLNTKKFVGFEMFDVVAESETSADGKEQIINLVRDNPDLVSDDLLLYAETPAREGSYIYHPKWLWFPQINSFNPPTPLEYPVTWNSSMGNSYNYIFNNEFQDVVFDETLYMTPANPRIAGRVMFKSVPLKGAKCYTSYFFDGVDYTDIDGLFAFNNLPIINDSRSLTIKKYGYEDYYVEEVGRLIAGNQKWFDIEMIPWGLIAGNVVNAEGEAVEAYVQVDTLTMNLTQRYTTFFPQYSVKEKFRFRAPSGMRRVRIFPVSNNYMPLDTMLFILKNQNPDILQNLGTFVLKENKHRIRIHITYTPPPENGMFGFNPLNVQLARVTCNGIVRYTNTNGNADFEFKSPETQFLVDIEPPTGTEFVGEQITVNNFPSHSFITTEVPIEMGYKLEGTVTGGNNNEPVAGARVFVDMEGNDHLTVFSNNVGHYVMHGVPYFNTQNIDVKAAAQSSQTTYTGQKKTITPGTQTLNFHLEEIDFMDISTLWGLPVEIENLYYKQRNIYINGAFVNLTGHQGIKVANPAQRLPFEGVQIKPSGALNSNGKPIAEPVNEEVVCTITTFPLTVFEQFSATQISNHKVFGAVSLNDKMIRIKKNTDNRGFLLGRVYLNRSSFNLPAEQFNVNDKNNLNLCKHENQYPFVISFIAPGSLMFSSNEFDVVNRFGKDPVFSLNGFQAEATDGSAKLKATGLWMDIKLNPSYPLVDFSAALEAKNVGIKKNNITFTGSTATFSIGLEEWDIACNGGWRMPSSESRIVIPNVTVQTGLVDLSAGALHLLPNRMDFEEIHYETMTLANVVPLTVEPGAESTFYLDPSANPDGKMHYVLKLTGQYPSGVAASFTGLEGLPQGTRIRIPTLQLISNNKMILAGFETLNEPLVFYNNLTLRLQMMAAKDNYLKLTGLFDLQIPGLRNDMTADLKFINDGAGHAVMMPLSLNIRFEGKGQVEFIAGRNEGDQDLNSTRFQASGNLKVTDKGATRDLAATLFRQKRPNGQIYVEVDEPQLTLGGINDPILRIDKGEMRVVNQQWDYLWFEGPLQNTNGLSQNGTSQKNRFVVEGAINASDSEVTVDGIETPLGGLKLTYSIPRSEFIGELDMPTYNIGAAAFGGTLNARFGSNGWYFMGCGSGRLPVIGGVNKMAVLLADYDDTRVFIEELKQYTIRNNFTLGNSFNGIFISAGKNDLFGLELPSFDWGVTIPVINQTVGVSLDWDALVGIDMKTTFDNPDYYVLGTRGFVSGKLTVNAGFAYAKGGVYVEILGEGVTELSPPYMSFNQCWAAGLSGEIGGSIFGVGSGSIGFSKTLHARLFIEQSGFGNIGDINISFGEGGCDE